MSIQIAYDLNGLSKHMLNMELGGLVYDPRDRRPLGGPNRPGPTAEQPRTLPDPFPVATDPEDPRGGPAYRIRPTYGVVMLPPGVPVESLQGEDLGKIRDLMAGGGRDHLHAPRATAVSPYTTIVSNPVAMDPPCDIVVQTGFPTEASDAFIPARMFRLHSDSDFEGTENTVSDFVPSYGFTWHFVPFESYHLTGSNMATQIVLPAVTVLYDPKRMFSAPKIPWRVKAQDLRTLEKVRVPAAVSHIGISPESAFIFDGGHMPPLFLRPGEATVSSAGSVRCWLCRELLYHHYHRFTTKKNRNRHCCNVCWKEFCARWPQETPRPPHETTISGVNAALAAGGPPQRLQEGVYVVPGLALLVPIGGVAERLYNLGELNTTIKYLIKYGALGIYE